MNRNAVIEAYAQRANDRDPDKIVGPALRTRSRAIRDVVVELAAGRQTQYDELASVLEASGPPPASMLETASRRRWLAALARLLAAQNLDQEDRSRARSLFDAVFDHAGADGLDSDHQTVYGQLLFLEGAHDRLAEILPNLEQLPDVIGHYLRCDLANPVAPGGRRGNPRWLDLLSQPFVRAGLEPVTLAGSGDTPFDQLTSAAKPASVSGPLVTVIMTSFRPDDTLFTAVRSILDQTWADLELIIVDDASGAEFDGYFQACLDLDSRVSLVRREVNGGTYLGRNAALDQARGDYVTFQDSDDWSHPRRIERQLSPLLDDDTLAAARSLMVRAHPDLTHQWLGYPAQRANPWSLMFGRQRVLKRVGYFDSIRKGADAEYAFRLEAAFGQRIHDVQQPLAYYRLHSSSLSRADFSLGWSAPVRIGHQAAYLHWHRAIAEGGASPYRSADPEERPFPVPAAFLDRIPGAPTPRRHYDVILLDDWLPHGGPLDAALDEISALTDEGLAVGIAHLESPGLMTAVRKQISRPVQQLVNDGTIDRVLLDEAVSAALLVVRDPSVLQFPPAGQPALCADRVVVARRSPRPYPGLGVAHDRATCQASAQAMFGRDPVWLARTETTAGPDGAQAVLASPIAPSRWAPRSGARPRGGRSVIGMYDTDTETHLVGVGGAGLVRGSAAESRTILSRVARRASRLTRRVARTAILPAWDIRERGKRSWREYLDEVDFLACFPNDNASDAPVAVMVRALAAGVVVLAPERFRDSLDDAAVYCTRDSVRAAVQKLHSDSTTFRAQVDRGLDYVARHHAPAEFVKRIQELASVSEP